MYHNKGEGFAFNPALTLIDMRGDTFISLYFLDLTFSAEFLSKISKKNWEVKIDIDRLILIL